MLGRWFLADRTLTPGLLSPSKHLRMKTKSYSRRTRSCPSWMSNCARTKPLSPRSFRRVKGPWRKPTRSSTNGGKVLYLSPKSVNSSNSIWPPAGMRRRSLKSGCESSRGECRRLRRKGPWTWRSIRRPPSSAFMTSGSTTGRPTSTIFPSSWRELWWRSAPPGWRQRKRLRQRLLLLMLKLVLLPTRALPQILKTLLPSKFFSFILLLWPTGLFVKTIYFYCCKGSFFTYNWLITSEQYCLRCKSFLLLI